MFGWLVGSCVDRALCLVGWLVGSCVDRALCLVGWLDGWLFELVGLCVSKLVS